MNEQLKRILDTTLQMMPQTLGDQQLAVLRSELEKEGSATRILWESTVQASWVEQSQGDSAWDILQNAYRLVCDELVYLKDTGIKTDRLGWPASVNLASLMDFFLGLARDGREPTRKE